MTSIASGRRIVGSLRSVDGKGVVRMEDRLDADIGELWSALTDPRRLALWLGEVDGDLRPGGGFRARFVASGWEGTGRIESCKPPPRPLVWTKDRERPDASPIEVTLTEDGDQTIFVGEERGMRLDRIGACGAGIQIHVKDLADHVAGDEGCGSKARFDALFPVYPVLAEAKV